MIQDSSAQKITTTINVQVEIKSLLCSKTLYEKPQEC